VPPALPADVSKMQALAHWDAFLTDVERLNTYVAPKRLPRYQRDLLDSASFEVVSPVTGEKIRVTTSRMGNGCFAYRLHSRMWLITGGLADQYSLNYFLSDTEFSVCGGGELRPGSVRDKHRREFLTMEQDHRNSLYEDIPDNGTQLAMMIGHENFAHHLWNELSALEEWMSGASDAAIAALTIVPKYEPLGPLDEIFPRLKAARFVRADLETQYSFLQGARIVVRPCGKIVSRAIRERIVEYCGDRLASGAWPRVWISVRTGSRTPDNQVAFIVAAAGKILAAYPDAEFLLDGFSFPVGFDRDVRFADLREIFKERSGECDAVIEKIIGEARNVLGSSKSARISSASGTSITDAIAAAGTCHYYVCHSGSLQHKIGWLHEIPGTIHGPNNLGSSRLWHVRQVEGGITPDVLPAELIATSTTPHSGPDLPRNINYAIADVDRAADAIAAAMKMRL
jgi:hypothetical protein